MRDARNIKALVEDKWRVLIVWEWALKGKFALPSASIAELAKARLNSTEQVSEISGKLASAVS